MSDLLIKQDLISLPGNDEGQLRLVGGRCTVCDYCCFPPKAACPKCIRDDCMEKIKLGPKAILESFAVMQVGPPDIAVPYIMAYVRTAEGALIFTLVTGCEVREGALELGQEMEVVLDIIKQDDQGNSLIGWKFKPVGRDRT